MANKISSILLLQAGILVMTLCWASESFAASPYPLDEALDLLSKQLLSNRTTLSQKKAAVADLTPLYGEMGNLGAFLAEELSARLAKQHVLMLERHLLTAAMNELRLNATDLVDPKYAKRFGQFTGTEVLLLGTMSDLPETIKINVRLLNIESRMIVGAGSVELRKTNELMKVMGIPYPGSLLVTDTPSSSSVYLDGKLVGSTDWRGRLKVSSIKPGSYAVLIQRDGYRSESRSIEIREDAETTVEGNLHSLPSRGTAVFLSLLFPGGGDIYLGHSDWWLYTLGVGGSIWGAVEYSKKTEEWIYVDEKNPSLGVKKRGDGPVYLFAGLAALIWGYDLMHVYATTPSSNLIQTDENNRSGYYLDLKSQEVMIGYRWSLP
ncbi:MAG: PEGA domain-containing protein [Nitrospirae bacterium]|nr:PEGA domain-containing protein [Nitrospirota bacterium]